MIQGEVLRGLVIKYQMIFFLKHYKKQELEQKHQGSLQHYLVWPKGRNNLSTDEWIKMWYSYTMEYYSAVKRDEVLTCYMDETKNIKLVKKNSYKRTNNHMIPLI